MKKILLLIVILFSVSFSFAQEEELSEKEKARREKNIQAGNPFKRFGYTPKIATLSKGKYLEFHDLDSIVTIGSYSYHVKRKAITGYTKLDTVHPESTLRPEIISRWFSPDPLSDEFPSWSPYTYANNNPIFFTDPTGLAPQGLLDDYGIDKKGNITLLKKTNDNFDRLFAVNTNENGETQIDKSKGSVKINKYKDNTSIISDLVNNKKSSTYLNQDDIEETASETIATTPSSYKNDIFKVFKFAADNSNVEWSVNKYSIMPNSPDYQIGTNFSSAYSPGFKGLGMWLGMVHSHPNEPSLSDRLESLYGDKSVSASYANKYGNKKPYLIYFPNTRLSTKIKSGKSSIGTNTYRLYHNLKSFKF